MNILGIDVGGTKISICLADKHGKIYASKKLITTELGHPDQGLKILVTFIKEFTCEQGSGIEDIQAIGLAVPGPVCLKKELMLTPPNMPLW